MGGERVARAKGRFTRVLAASNAAALAYGLARLFAWAGEADLRGDHRHHLPRPGIPSHFRQSVNISSACSTASSSAYLAFLLLPGDIPELQMALAVFIAMLAGATLVDQPVVPIQAGSSALW